MQTTAQPKPGLSGPEADKHNNRVPVVVAVLGVLAVVAAGAWWVLIRDSSSSPEPVEVTGSEVCSQTFEEGGVLWYECQETTSDKRVSGTAVVSVRLEQEPPTAMDGTFELTNDGRTWKGDWTGEITSSNNHIMESVLVGGGDYEGLQYRVRWEGVSEPFAITGTIEPIP